MHYSMVGETGYSSIEPMAWWSWRRSAIQVWRLAYIYFGTNSSYVKKIWEKGSIIFLDSARNSRILLTECFIHDEKRGILWRTNQTMARKQRQRRQCSQRHPYKVDFFVSSAIDRACSYTSSLSIQIFRARQKSFLAFFQYLFFN
jgi:hypothetical protein